MDLFIPILKRPLQIYRNLYSKDIEYLCGMPLIPNITLNVFIANFIFFVINKYLKDICATKCGKHLLKCSLKSTQ